MTTVSEFLVWSWVTMVGVTFSFWLGLLAVSVAMGVVVMSAAVGARMMESLARLLEWGARGWPPKT